MNEDRHGPQSHIGSAEATSAVSGRPTDLTLGSETALQDAFEPTTQVEYMQATTLAEQTNDQASSHWLGERIAARTLKLTQANYRANLTRTYLEAAAPSGLGWWHGVYTFPPVAYNWIALSGLKVLRSIT